MHEQNEALQLADSLTADDFGPLTNEAASELRRQHQEIQELKKAKDELLSVLQSTEYYLEVVRSNIERHFPQITRLEVQDTVQETLTKYKD